MRKTWDVNLVDDTGKTRILTIKNSFKAVILIEEDYEEGVIGLIQRIHKGEYKLMDIVRILDAGLRGNGDTRYSFEDLGEMCLAKGFVDVLKQLDEFLVSLVYPKLGGLNVDGASSEGKQKAK